MSGYWSALRFFNAHWCLPFFSPVSLLLYAKSPSNATLLLTPAKRRLRVPPFADADGANGGGNAVVVELLLLNVERQRVSTELKTNGGRTEDATSTMATTATIIAIKNAETTVVTAVAATRNGGVRITDSGTMLRYWGPAAIA